MTETAAIIGAKIGAQAGQDAYTFTESNGQVTIKVTLYGPVSRDRHDAEQLIARHRCEQLTPQKPKNERRSTYNQDRILQSYTDFDRNSFGPGGY